MTWKKVASSFPETWNYKEDKVIEGVLTLIKVDVGPNKSIMYYLEKKDHKQIGVWGSTILNGAMTNIGTGSEIRITYLGEKDNPKGGKPMHNFSVEVNE